MSALVAVVPTRILLRWDAIAAVQLCEAASRLAEEMDRLRGDLHAADDSAEFWREQVLDMQLQLCERTGGEPGITQACELVVVRS
ncbi:MAG: hypothetical protein WDO56_35055 [Gammaproteobacteria bacterium]